VLSAGRSVHKDTAPVIKLPPEASLDDHFDLLGLLNSSCLEFWGKQVFHCKGYGASGDGARTTAADWENFYQRDSTKLQKAPITNRDRQPRIALAAALDATATTRATYLPSSILATDFTADTLADLLARGREAYRALTHQLVALQEELDWLTYGSYGLLDPPLPTVPPSSTEPLAPGHRPFEIVAARLDDEADDDEKSAWWSRHGHARSTEIPNTYSDLHRQRIQARIDAIEADPRLQLLETFAFKRRWQTPDLLVEAKKACESYLLDRLEDLFAPRTDQSRHTHSGALSDPRPYRLEEIAAVWGRDPRVQAVIDLWQATTGYDLGLAAEKLLRSQALPDHDQRIYAEEGLRKRAQWRETWALQDREDAGESDLDIPVPPQYQKPDFQKPSYYEVRGKLDVPRERFVAFDDLSPGRWGWNGWRDLNRGLAQAAVWDLAANDPGEPLPMPTAADPRRCGATLGLWQSLDDVRRWSDPGHHAELRDLAESACGRSQCPCDVLPAWQNWRRTGKLSIAAAVQAPSVSLDERAMALQILADLADKVRDLLEVREGGGTLADVAARWPWSREKLPGVLDDLLASGDVRTEGRGEGRRFLVRVQPGTKR
jgi:hypothetical protein